MMRSFLAGALALLATPALAQQDRPLRMVMNTELQVLDPILSSSIVTRTFGFFVWDTLVARDGQGNYRPQMLEGWQVSDDRLTWTFKLRPGLEFHDGTPVTANDCVASLRRWAARDGLGRLMMAAAKGLRVVDDSTFVLELNQPFGQVLEALGKVTSAVPFIMPARIAEGSPNTPITEIIGSGPFTFSRAEWRPTDRVVFHRNARYRPRPEPADAMAGGKVVHVERAEIVTIPDHSTKVAALQQGEIDFIEYIPLDFVDILRRDRRVVVTPGAGLSQNMGALTLNHSQPPFNNPAVRRAAQLAIDQAEVVAGLGLPRGMAMDLCVSIFMCGLPYDNDAGAALLRAHGTERARAMLRQAGYNNEPVTFLHSADTALISPISLVAADQLRRAGFNVDFRSSDWSTIAQLRLRRDTWSIVPVVWTGFALENPLANPAVVYNCDEEGTAWGWYCDPARTPLLAEFAREADPARRRALAARMQQSVHEDVSVVILGQFATPGAYRAELRGVLDTGFPVLWNIQRAAR